jgi:hypothetical protein
MNEQELRGLVREAIERHLGRPEIVDRPSSIVNRPSPARRSAEREGGSIVSRSSDHASHILLKVVPGSQIDDGMCVIEPAVRCNHCGFCQSYGH